VSAAAEVPADQSNTANVDRKEAALTSEEEGKEGGGEREQEQREGVLA
jgi:hypothetical protein